LNKLRVLVVDDEPVCGSPWTAPCGNGATVPEADGLLNWISSMPAPAPRLPNCLTADVDILLLDTNCRSVGSGSAEPDQRKVGHPYDHDDAYASLEVAIAATKRGAFDFLAKPFTPRNCGPQSRRQYGSLCSSPDAQANPEGGRCGSSSSPSGAELKAPLAAIEVIFT